jgi:hypothetical protein
MIGRFGQVLHIMPVLSPIAIGTAAFNTALVDMANAHRCTFILHIGATDSSSGSPTITLLASTVGTTVGATAIAFKYRISAAINTDTLGAITDATSAGVLTVKTDDGMIYLIDVDPALVAGKTDGRWVYLHAGANASRTMVVGCVAEIEPRYIATSPTSAS